MYFSDWHKKVSSGHFIVSHMIKIKKNIYIYWLKHNDAVKGLRLFVPIGEQWIWTSLFGWRPQHLLSGILITATHTRIHIRLRWAIKLPKITLKLFISLNFLVQTYTLLVSVHSEMRCILLGIVIYFPFSML